MQLVGRFEAKFGGSLCANTQSGPNRSIFDEGWHEFRRQLDYKLAWNGGYLIGYSGPT
jgi:transposase